MSETQWREFMREWARYKRSTEISGQLLLDQLHSCCSAPLRLDMASEVGDELDDMQEDQLLKTMRRMAVKETNPMVHRNKLRSMLQGETERYRQAGAELCQAQISLSYVGSSQLFLFLIPHQLLTVELISYYKSWLLISYFHISFCLTRHPRTTEQLPSIQLLTILLASYYQFLIC